MRLGVLVLGALSSLATTACPTRAEVATAVEDPCFVVSAPLERMVISCHPASGAGACSFKVDRAEQDPVVHVASLQRGDARSCQAQAEALVERRASERKTCPAGTRRVRSDCVPI